MPSLSRTSFDRAGHHLTETKGDTSKTDMSSSAVRGCTAALIGRTGWFFVRGAAPIRPRSARAGGPVSAVPATIGWKTSTDPHGIPIRLPSQRRQRRQQTMEP
jgi:hypothetical protein